MAEGLVSLKLRWFCYSFVKVIMLLRRHPISLTQKRLQFQVQVGEMCFIRIRIGFIFDIL